MNKSFLDFELFAAPERSTGLEKIRGQGQSGILILFSIQGDGQDDDTYLSAILNPLKFNLQRDTFILPLQKNETVSFAAILQQHAPKFVLLFGCAPKDCGIRISLPDYQPVKFNGIYFLHADSLHQIRTDRENNDNRRAGALWAALKEIFM